MIRPASPADPDRLATRWYAELADALGEVARRVSRLSEDIARDWPDDRGREWAHRTAHVCQRLVRDLVVAAELGAASTLPPADPVPGASGPPFPGSGQARRGGRDAGLRLGDTGGSRAEDDRGIRIAELPDPQDPSG